MSSSSTHEDFYFYILIGSELHEIILMAISINRIWTRADSQYYYCLHHIALISYSIRLLCIL